MRATEDNGVRAGGDCRAEDLANNGVRGRGRRFATFDKFSQAYPGRVRYLRCLAEFIDDARVKLAVEGARRGEDDHFPGARLADGWLQPRHHPHEGHRERLAEVGDGGG